jgi:hypothetical protein
VAKKSIGLQKNAVNIFEQKLSFEKGNFSSQQGTIDSHLARIKNDRAPTSVLAFRKIRYEIKKTTLEEDYLLLRRTFDVKN